MRRLVGCVSVTAALVLALTATSASAKPLNLRTASDAVQTLTVGAGSADVLPLAVDRLMPGSTVVQRYELDRAATLSGGQFAAAVTDVKDYERGCNHPEVAAGDVTCGSGAGQGELSTQLLLKHRWSADVTGCEQAPLPTDGATVADVANQVLEAPADVNQADHACLVLVVDLPAAADNLVQSDAVEFSLRLGLQDAAHAGDFTAGGGGLTVVGGTLPATGLDLWTRLAASALLASAGTALLLAGRRRRHQPA